MYSVAKVKGHPIHPMLVALPITCYILAFVGFLTYESISQNAFWYKLGYFSTWAAIITALVTAVPGFIDWSVGIPKGTAAKRTGLVHMTLNLLTLGVFIINAFVISGTWDAPPASAGWPLFLTLIGVFLVGGAGFYGWELIGHNKVGVDLSPEQERLENSYQRSSGPHLIR